MRKRGLKITVLALLMALVVMPINGAASFLNLDPDSNANWGTQDITPSTAFPHSAVKTSIASYKAVNPQVAGWLAIPNTNINFPIMLSKENNKYYEHRDWKGTNYPNLNYQNYVDTATYLDFRTVLGTGWKQGTSRNMVIYGHNWNNLRTPFVIGNKTGYSMFGQLPSYTSIDFAKANPHIYFSTADYEGIWRVFAVGYSELSNTFFYNDHNPGDAAYQAIINEWKDRSLFDFGVDVDTTDRILTLSTCTRQYSAGEMQRYVVVARLLRPDESESDAVAVAVNPDVKSPAF